MNNKTITVEKLTSLIKEVVRESLTEGCGKIAKRELHHIEKSEKEAGKSKKDSEKIAYATLNKQGKLNEMLPSNVNRDEINKMVIALGDQYPTYTYSKIRELALQLYKRKHKLR